MLLNISELYREKTCIRGFRPGPTQKQTVRPQKMDRGLRLENSDKGSRGIRLSM